MITLNDFYEIISALVPLYVAMILAYSSVRWWKIFTPEQCSGISRFVSSFAVPFLSFHFIYESNPYTMNFRFIIADTLQKVLVLFLLFSWQIFTKFGSIDWLITLFSLSTLPNTLVMGVPLLKAMYGDFTTGLMTQVVVLQSIVWYTVLIFLFEYRGAKTLISEQFSADVIKSIASFKVDSDVVSLTSRDPLHTSTNVREDGKLHVVISRSSSKSNTSIGLNTVESKDLRGLDLTEMEIYSLPSSTEVTPRSLNFKKLTSFRKIASLKEGVDTKFERLKGDGSNDNEGIYSTSSENNENSAKKLHMFAWSTNSLSIPEKVMFTKSGTSRSISEVESTYNGLQGSRHEDNQVERNKTNRESQTSGKFSQKNPTSLANPPLFVVDEAIDNASGTQGTINHPMPSTIAMARLILIIVGRKLIRNPNTYASILGLVWSLISFRWNIKLPKIIDGSISILSNTGLGMAMFNLGLFMGSQPKILACGKKMTLISSAIRFLVGPIIIAVTSIVVGIRGNLLRVSILQASLPQAIVPFVFAKDYNCHPDILSTGVVFGMVIALPITIIYYILLGL